MVCINSSSPGENGHHFPDIFKCIFINDKFWIFIQISLKFVPKGAIDKKSALFQVMAWHQTGDKPLPGAMLTQYSMALREDELMLPTLLSIC